GRILRTRVSRPADNTTYGANLWALILTEQLQVSEHEFWECVSNRNPPERGFGSGEAPPTALPAQLVDQLIHDLGVQEAEIVGMTLEHATELMVAYWSEPGRP
ncbi:MAG: cytotoxic translational repressor of toxin-antitoxin stability system, partial [Dermatophilaceae bacterium]